MRTYVVQMTSWAVINFPFFNMFQYSPNEIDRRGLVQKKNNLNNAIFGYFGLMQLQRAKAIKGSTVYPFEEVTGNSKITLVLTGKLFQLKRNLEMNMTGCTS